MGKFDTSVSCSSLLCQETGKVCLLETEREDDESVYFNYFVLENVDEYIKKLVERETDVGFKTNAFFSDFPTTGKSWLECARLDAIEWIFNVCFSVYFYLCFFLISCR